MKKNELMNGDIVVTRNCKIAVVIGAGDDAQLLFQYGGFEFLCFYDDEMVYGDDEDAVMQVFRPNGAYGFEGVDQEYPIYERDESWRCPGEKEREEQHRVAVEQCEARWNAPLACTAEGGKDQISIIAQGFYGNRTGTRIQADEVDRFILGYMSDEFPVTEPIDRTVIHLPGSDEFVLIYNKYQEEEHLAYKAKVFEEENYVLKPLVDIPEMDLEIYSRCIVCRMDENGEIKSLENDDFKIWNQYLAF